MMKIKAVIRIMTINCVSSFTSYTAERARQEKLARDRIAALRAKKRAKAMTHSEKVLEELEKDIDNDVRLADQLEREGSIVYQNAVLDEMEKKHHSEQEVGHVCGSFERFQ